MTVMEFETPPLTDELNKRLPALVAQAKESVVQIYNQSRGAGAGVVWGINGRILTNNHVVERGPDRVQVMLQNGRTFEALVMDRNPMLDLAILQAIDTRPGDLRLAALGDSTSLRVGELVFAVGHPWGQRHVVTAGIISGFGQANLPRYNQPLSYILSDVLLRPGNSGGPLLNAYGGVIGLNAMIQGGDLSVAIPSHTIQSWIESLEQII